MPAANPDGHFRLSLFLATGVFVAHAVWLACIAEDAYISFRYAANLAAGEGWVWNPGEAPVEGFTNLLWTLLAALVEVLGLPMPRAMQVLGVVFGAGTLWLADRIARDHLGLRGLARALPVWLLALSGPLATWSASGLETPLFALLALATIDAFARWRRELRTGAAIRGLALLALATLTRPEGVLIAAALAVLALGMPRSAWRRWLWIPAAFAGFLGALTLWRLAVFGAPLPNTFYAKTGGGARQALRGLVYLGFFALHYLLPIAPLLAASAAWRGEGGDRSAESPARRVALALAAYALVHGAYVVAVGGDYMAMYRFFAPILPALALLAGCGTAALLVVGRTAAPLRPVIAALLVLAAALTAVQSTPLEAELFEKAPRQHGTWRGVETERWHVDRLRLLSRVFSERAARAPGSGNAAASVATTAIGVIGYESGLAVHDFNGLVDPVIARGSKAKRPLGSGLPGHEKSDPARVLARRPTYWMFTRRLRDEPEGWPRYDPATDAALRREYELVHVELEDRANHETGFFSFLERRDAP